MTEQPQLNGLQYDEQGLLPLIVQDWLDGTVLMVGFTNREALSETIRTQRVHFWSRSRQQLWRKGETSGHELHVKHLFVDCDSDTLLVKAEPVGPTCHTGNRSCFFTEMLDEESDGAKNARAAWGGILERLYEMVLQRKAQPQKGSYMCQLLEANPDRMLKKIVEESGEVVLAAKNESREEIIHEVADLWFHTLIVLGRYSIPPEEIYQELGKRFGKSGLRKKEEGPTSE